MSTERLAKWSKEAKEFFEKAEDNSIVLDLVISYGCASQTGEGFEELVNTINAEEIKRKVKKVVITDTSYLYRHVIPEFVKYADPSIPTEWYLKNKEAIEKLEVENELKSWASGINSEEFKKWYQKIMIDFGGDEKGNNINLEFRDKVMQASSVGAYKNNTNIKGCIEFMLEETVYTCAFLNGSALVYPSGLAEPIVIAAERYKISINHLKYELSTHAQKNSKKVDINFNDIDKEVLSFIRDKVSNANFFVIDNYGNHIYKNYALSTLVNDANAKSLSNNSWENSARVMRENKQIMFEETDKSKTFLSVKSPLVINGKVEGVIGLAVDITDRKKKEELEKEELENKLKIREELYKIAKEVSHDIASPVMSLKIIEEMYKGKLKEQDERMLKTAIRSIEDMVGKMLSKYRINKNVEMGRIEEVEEKEEEVYINVYESMKDIVENMRYRSKGEGVEIKIEREKGKVCIKGDKTDFRRMMINVIKNGIEAIGGKEGEIKVRYEEKEEVVEIKVKDNGKGMSKGMAEKIERGEEIGTTKKEGRGIGMGQVMGVVREMKGKIKVESREGEGTEFILAFPKVERPRWFADKIEIKKGDEVVIVDDEELMHEVWKAKLKEYEKEIRLKFFKQGVEALKYLKSLKDKEKVFLLTDYRLKGQEVNGIDIIEEAEMKERHILVTGEEVSRIKDFNEKSKFLKMLPKIYINDISLELVQVEEENIISD
jgi:signal transduction histidine kinase